MTLRTQDSWAGSLPPASPPSGMVRKDLTFLEGSQNDTLPCLSPFRALHAKCAF